MNKASKQRIKWAESLAAVYASHPDVYAIIVGGSTARGIAHQGSDIDLGLFWTQVPSPKERGELIDRIGGQISRCIENHHRYSVGNPRSQGCIEIVEIQPTAGTPGLGLDIEHETMAGTELVLSDVVDQVDPSLEKQELLSVIESGIVLYGHDLVNRWREKTQYYPDALVVKMVNQNLLGIGAKLLDQARWVSSQDWFILYEGFLDIGRRLFLTLMGLNRVWVYTDNPNFKGLKSFAGRLTWQPDQFVDRLGLLLQGNANISIHGFADLVEEVLMLIDVHLTTVDISGERELIKEVKHKAARRPVSTSSD